MNGPRETNDRARLERKLRRNESSILSDGEIDMLVAEARRVLKKQQVRGMEAQPVRFADHVRWSSLAARCRQARAEKGLDVKQAASGAKIPRYRVDGIEKGRITELLPEMAWQYFEFLEIQGWVGRWIRSNLELARRAGIHS